MNGNQRDQRVLRTTPLRRLLPTATLGFSLFALAACTARLGGSASEEYREGNGGGPPAGVDPATLPPYAPPPGALRRLTRTQFKNAVFDLLGRSIDPTRLDPDGYNGDFAVTGAATVVTSNLGAEQYLATAEEAVSEVFGDAQARAELLGCEPTSVEEPCVEDFITNMGRRAWRRSLTQDELEQLLTLARLAQTEMGSAVEGARWATVALFASPHFVYRPELGEPDGKGGLRLTPYEIAGRLAFLLWNSPPDEQLLDDAENGLLGTTEGILMAAERLLQDERGRESVTAFAEDYMRLDRVMSQPKDAGLFPDYGPTLQAAMVTEMKETWARVAFDEESSVLDVFDTRLTVVNDQLALLYGLDATSLGADSEGLMHLPEGGPRGGILTRAGFLSQFANQKEGSPTLRGKFIREAILCDHVPAPPADVALEIPEFDASAPTTKRDRLAAHREAKTCAGCHSLMDPLGLPLEQFDAIGRFRETEHGLTIDPSGEFEGVVVDDARALGEAMSDSDAVAACIVRKYYQYAMGHQARDVDEGQILALSSAFDEAGRRFRALVTDIVTHEGFVTVAPPSE